MNRIATSALPSILFASLLVVPAAQASLMNGDFSAGFAGWTGEVEDINGVTTLQPPPGTFPDNFDASSGAAVLSTSELDNGVFFTSLFQGFTVDTALPGETLLLSLDLATSLAAAPAEGLAFAQLSHGPGLLETVDLFAATSHDVTVASGQEAELFFGVLIFAGSPDHSLTVDEIAITRVTAAVPVPATLPLIVLGMLALLGPVRQRR